MSEIKTNFEQLISKLRIEGNVVEVTEEDRKLVMSGVEAELNDYWIVGQKKQQDSLVTMSSLILTA